MKPELTLVEDTGSQLAQDVKQAPEPPPQQTEMPFAVVEGEPLTELPRDLYIPPDALQVFLEAFEGPLDLLLYLIRRQNLDILDIPIAEITRQYMQYIEVMAELQLELAGEYLLMAAMLAEIKSRMLLPRPPAAEGEEEEDPRAELVRRLQEYERFKKAAEDIDQLARMERDTIIASAELQERKVVKLVPEVSLEEMLKAIKDVLSRAEMFAHHRISRERLSVRERMTHILDQLQHSDNFCEFVRLFRPEEGRMGVTVTFSAVLELLKGGMIEIAQAEPYAPLHVRVPTGKRKVISDEASADADAQNQAALAQPAFPDEDELDDELEALSSTPDGEHDGNEDAADADADADAADVEAADATVSAADDRDAHAAEDSTGIDKEVGAGLTALAIAGGAASADSADADAQNLAALAQPAFPDEDELDDELADDSGDLSLTQAVHSASDAAAHSGTYVEAGAGDEAAGTGGEADAEAAAVVDAAEAGAAVDADAATVDVDARAVDAAADADADLLLQGDAVTHDVARTGEVSPDAVDIDLIGEASESVVDIDFIGDADGETAVAADSSLDASDEFADQAAEVALDFSADDDDAGSILDAESDQLTDADLALGESVEYAPQGGSDFTVEDDSTTSALEAEANELMDAGYANDASSGSTSGVALDFSAKDDAPSSADEASSFDSESDQLADTAIASEESADLPPIVTLDSSAGDDASVATLDAGQAQLQDARLEGDQGFEADIETDIETDIEADIKTDIEADAAGVESISTTDDAAVRRSTALDIVDAGAAESATHEQEQVDIPTDERRVLDPDATPEDDMSESDAPVAQDADTRHE